MGVGLTDIMESLYVPTLLHCVQIDIILQLSTFGLLLSTKRQPMTIRRSLIFRPAESARPRVEWHTGDSERND